MANAHLPFWNGDEDREIRVFISHRFEADSVLYDEALAKLRSQGHAIQDMSLNVDTLIRGPNGGQRPLLEIKAQVAARIYTSDILMAPARPATTRSEWLSWEIELAAVGYGLPVLEGAVRRNRKQKGFPWSTAGTATPGYVGSALSAAYRRITGGLRKCRKRKGRHLETAKPYSRSNPGRPWILNAATRLPDDKPKRQSSSRSLLTIIPKTGALREFIGAFDNRYGRLRSATSPYSTCASRNSSAIAQSLRRTPCGPGRM
jgi:hypothetical protein